MQKLVSLSPGLAILRTDFGRWLQVVVLVACCLIGFVGQAHAEPNYPALTGRVVDQANLLEPETETALEARLATLEQETGDQLVVVTLRDLEGLPIEEYGYQLGRHWGIGQKDQDNGVLLIVAPNDRKVRIEVGYGLEGILTDAMSAMIIQNEILPHFRTSAFNEGIVSGVSAIEEQLRLDPVEAEARAQAAAAARDAAPAGSVAIPAGFIFLILILLFFMAISFGGRGRRMRMSSRDAAVLIWMANEASRNRGRGGRDHWGGGGFGGGGGFSGGGGSFGGGGASGGW